MIRSAITNADYQINRSMDRDISRAAKRGKDGRPHSYNGRFTCRAYEPDRKIKTGK
jgi:hypothetical protein